MWQSIVNFFKNLFSTKAPVPPVSAQPVHPIPKTIELIPWMTLAKVCIGQPTITGEPPTNFDKMIFSHTDDDPLGNGPMKSGCAAFVCAMLELSGYKSTRSANAFNQSKLGTALSLPVYGCVCVLEGLDGPGSHHTTFFNKTNTDGSWSFLGGNQNHMVKYSDYDPKHVISMRWPDHAS